MTLDLSTNGLDAAIEEYNTSFTDFHYDLPEFWMKRDRYGLPFNHANLPFFSHIANFLVVEINAGSFPWGYIYGALSIEDSEAKVIESAESLMQMAMSMTAFLPALLLLLSAFLIPITFCLVYIFRLGGACGGTIDVKQVAYQKSGSKIFHCTMAVLFSLAILFGSIQFWTCANPLVTVLPEIITNIVRLGLQDFNKFFNYCIEEIKYFLEEGLVKLLLGAVVTITQDFGFIVDNITAKLDLLELKNITATLDNVTTELQTVRSSLEDASTEVDTINLVVTAVNTNYMTVRASLQSIQVICATLGALQSVVCAGIPSPADLPSNANNFQFDLDVKGVIQTVDDLDLEGMFADYQAFNLSLVKDLARKSIPLDTIEKLITSRAADVQKGIDWDKLNPITPKMMDQVITSTHEVLQNRVFSYTGHVIRGLLIIPLIYVIVVCLGIAMGIYATHDQKFPCPERNPTSSLASDFINRAQMAVLCFHVVFAILCAALLIVMSILSIVAHSIYTQDIVDRIIDRIPLDVLDRSFTVDLGGSEISSVVTGGVALRVCESNGGALKAIGINVGHFTNITNVLDVIPWPDLQEFRSTLEGELDHIEESAIPKHGRTEVVQQYLDSFVLPSANFDQLQASVLEMTMIEVAGQNKSLEEFANDLEVKSNEIRSAYPVQGDSIADELDNVVASIRYIQRDIQLISDRLSTLKMLYDNVVPIIEDIKTQVTTLYGEMLSLGKKLLAEARIFLSNFVIDATVLLNSLKLKLRKSVFEIIDFLLNNMFKCRIFFDIFTVISEVLYLYIVRYLNGVWFSLAAICLWVFCAISCWQATDYFKVIGDLNSKKRLLQKLRKERLLTPTTSDHKFEKEPSVSSLKNENKVETSVNLSPKDSTKSQIKTQKMPDGKKYVFP